MRRRKKIRKDEEEAEMKAGLRWAGMVKPTPQFLGVEDTTDFPCVI